MRIATLYFGNIMMSKVARGYYNNVWGELCKGYFCSWCGKLVGILGHTHLQRETGECIGNLPLVLALRRANPVPPKKPHFIYRQKNP